MKFKNSTKSLEPRFIGSHDLPPFKVEGVRKDENKSPLVKVVPNVGK